MPKTKKIDKEYLLTDSSVNVYGFRLLTEGYQVEEFKKNPIGYYMHNREDGVVLRWEDIRVDGDKVYGKPVINLSNARGQQTHDEVEGGFLNGASVGQIVALEFSDDPSMMLPGQCGPTITKWYNRECSLVDVPGNMNSLSLYDDKGNVINLADFTNQNSKMKQIFLTAAQLTLLNLKADADAALVDLALNDLVAKAKKLDDLQAKLDTATQETAVAEQKLADHIKAATETKVNDLVAQAVTEKKITVELADQFKKDYAGKPEQLEVVLKAMPAYQPITANLTAGGTDEALSKMSWAELDKAGKLEDLKAKNIDLFKAKYKEHFGNEYTAK